MEDVPFDQYLNYSQCQEDGEGVSESTPEPTTAGTALLDPLVSPMEDPLPTSEWLPRWSVFHDTPREHVSIPSDGPYRTVNPQLTTPHMELPAMDSDSELWCLSFTYPISLLSSAYAPSSSFSSYTSATFSTSSASTSTSSLVPSNRHLESTAFPSTVFPPSSSYPPSSIGSPPRSLSPLSSVSGYTSYSSSVSSATPSTPSSEASSRPSSPNERRTRPPSSQSRAKRASPYGRKSQPPRNLQLPEGVDPLSFIDAATMRCTLCGKPVNRGADLSRHARTHSSRPFGCVGLPLHEAQDVGLSEEDMAVQFELHGTLRVGGCWKQFSRRDAYQRHRKSCKGALAKKCIFVEPESLTADDAKNLDRFRLGL
ncbi:hypothetical protein C8Q76DRAFT_797255 [Earliella scabrosa]|nr:hypothetical protein C8Q76DRAFT_797255 [Earliella scabrosa]